jgi:hypothetical protein
MPLVTVFNLNRNKRAVDACPSASTSPAIRSASSSWSAGMACE